MGVIYRVDQRDPEESAVEQGVSVLERGGVLALPTDSVYGLACLASPGNPGHRRIFEIKRRESSQTLPIFLADASDLDVLAEDVPSWAQLLADRFWPGAVTLVVKAGPAIADEYRAADGTVALRCPDSPFVRELVRRTGPLAQTSANTHGSPAATSASELEEEVVEGVDLVFDGGDSQQGVASTIVDCTGEGPRTLREGAVSREELEAAVSQAR